MSGLLPIYITRVAFFGQILGSCRHCALMTQVRATVAGDNPHPRPSPDTQRRLVLHGSDIQRSNLRDCSSAKAVAHGHQVRRRKRRDVCAPVYRIAEW